MGKKRRKTNPSQSKLATTRTRSATTGATTRRTRRSAVTRSGVKAQTGKGEEKTRSRVQIGRAGTGIAIGTGAADPEAAETKTLLCPGSLATMGETGSGVQSGSLPARPP